MKKQKNLSRSSIEKIEKMYQAVISLLMDGADINALKVSEITARAGIGKGTAYEYFDSKEEIISNALKYDMARQMDSLLQDNKDASTFREKIMQTMKWIENNLDKKGSGIQFFKAIENSWEISGKIVKEFHHIPRKACGIGQILQMQIQSAVDEKIWPADAPELFMELTLESSYIEYFLYLSKREEDTAVSTEEMKEFIYQGLKKRW